MAESETKPAAELAADETRSPLLPDPTIPGPARLHYPALDGLRGVAILLVILFHGFLSIEWTSPRMEMLSKIPLAGWCGVDVFFVLSGFLITGILLDSRGGPRYFTNFYARRVLRIFPIYYLLLIFVFFVLPFLKPFDTAGLQTIRKNQWYMWTYLTNWGFVIQRKVWADADWLHLNHLWSLAVEEQFYLVWPVIVWGFSRRTIKALCVGCIVFSLALRCALWLTHQRNGAVYFPTPCRLDCLALGALAATLIRERDVASMARWARVTGLASAVLLGGLIAWRGGMAFNDSPTIVFGVTLIGFLSASVLVLAIQPGGSNSAGSILNNSVLRTAGKYSYAMYLFHAVIRTPLWSLIPGDRTGRWMGSELAGNLLFVVIFGVASFAMAFVSWHLYEKQWLKLKRLFEYERSRAPITPAVTTR